MRILLLIVLTLWMATTCSAEIALDAADTFYTGTNGTTHTYTNFTVGNHPNRLLLVFAGNADASTPCTSNVTFNGVNFEGKVLEISNAAFSCTGLWYLRQPDITTANVVVTTGASEHTPFTIVSLYDVYQPDPFRSSTTNTATGTTATSTSFSVDGLQSGDWVIDALHVRNAGGNPGALVPGAGTEIEELQVQTVYRFSARYQVSAGSSVTVGWTWTTSTAWTHVAVGIVPASGNPSYYYRNRRSQ